MNRLLPLPMVMLALTACHTKPVRTTETHRPDLQTAHYEDYVARRTQELEQMGGPFKDHAVAEAKAREEATDRFGEEPPTSSTTWTWGKGAKDPAAQAELEDKLDKMDRDAKR
jgi:hypothetical protein